MLITSIIIYLGDPKIDIYKNLRKLTDEIDEAVIVCGETEHDIIESVVSNTETLLMDNQSNKINLLYVGEIDNPKFRKYSVTIPGKVRENVDKRIAVGVLDINNIGIIMLPFGTSSEDSGCYAWLKEIYSLDIFKKVILLFPSNYDPADGMEESLILSREDFIYLAIEIIQSLICSDVLDRIQSFMDDPREKFLSAGVCKVNLPVDDIIENKTHEFSILLLKYYIDKKDSIYPQEITDFIEFSNLKANGVYENMVSWDETGDNMIMKVRFDQLLFDEIPLEILPKQISNYGDYLSNQLNRMFVKRVDSNQLSILKNVKEKLADKITSIITNRENPSISKAEGFLSNLWERIKEASDYLERFTTLDDLENSLYGNPVNPIDRLHKKLSNLRSYHDNLKDKIENRPLWTAVLLRYFLLGVICGYALRKVVNLFTISKSIMNIGFLSFGWIWFFVAFIFCIAIGILVIARSRAEIRNRTEDYMKAVLDNLTISLKDYIKKKMENLYKKYLRIIDNKDDNSDYENDLSFIDQVKTYRNVLDEIREELEKIYPEKTFRESRFKYSIIQFLDNKPDFHYKDDDTVSWENEIRDLAGIGIFDNWSKLAIDEMGREDFITMLKSYSKDGYNYIKNIKISDLLKNNSQKNNLDIAKKMLDISAPYMIPKPKSSMNFLLYPDEEETILDQLSIISESEKTQQIPASMGKSFALLQVAWNISFGSVKIFSIWNQAYQEHKDKSKIHNIDEWESLNDPIDRKNNADDSGINTNDEIHREDIDDESPI
ncbi:hypothetical protein GF312_20330 [Candidatus Poribacteria bacterium]|nr:hypothetical protein [Candidatus Poribacteria bacterium]